VTTGRRPEHSRPRSGSRGHAGLNKRRVILAGAAAVVSLVAALLLILLPGGGKPSAVRRPPASTNPPLAPSRCPLTDLPAPGGKIPARPALAVKIGNEPEGARPQAGLDEADIVYDTPAEAFIMRYIAVYQCNEASSIGPTRSVRWVDWHIMQQFVHPVLAFAGGIDPDVSAVSSLPWLDAADLLAGAQSAGVRISSRIPPDNLYTSTTALWALFKAEPAPTPVFTYTSALPAAARPAATLGIDFSQGTDVLWKWDAQSGSWLHTYDGTPDVDTLTNQPVTTTNIVVQIVHYTFGPYPESPNGSGDVESVTTGSGAGYVLRDGKEIPVTWRRPTTSSPTTFTDAKGQPVGLAPGRTWVELVPDTVASTAGALTLTP
jgi:hypothetical protein